MPSHFQLPAVSCNSAEPFPYLHLLSPIFMQEFCNVYSIPFPRSQLVTNHTVIMVMCEMIYQCCAKHVCRCLVLPELLLDSHASLSIFLSFFFCFTLVLLLLKHTNVHSSFPFCLLHVVVSILSRNHYCIFCSCHQGRTHPLLKCGELLYKRHQINNEGFRFVIRKPRTPR